MTQPYYDDGKGIQIYHGDCLEVLPTLNDVDLVLTDPPYGTGGWRRTASGAGSNPAASLVQEEWDDGSTAWVALTTAPIVTFWTASKTSHLLNAAIASGRTKHRALYMRKRDPKPMPGGRTRWSVEPVWVLSADGFLIYGGDDVIEVSTPRKGRDREATGHPYEKPLRAMTWLVSKTTAPTICDPFMGSGTTLLAAQLMGRRAIGIELDERYCEIAARRLQQEVMAFE